MLSEATQILFLKNYSILSSPTISLRLTSHGQGNYRNMKYFFAILLTSLSLTSTAALAQEVPQANLQRTALTAGIYQIDAQLAITPAEHAIGLMYRKEMEPHEGMLFVFASPSLQCFWMKNTLIPLTVAFLADDGMILNMDDMKPQTEESHCSIKPVRYVLEMNKGWFAKKGIKAGMKLTGQMFTSSK
ncbi:MAG: hypothetical protein RL710_1837 [Pseudomonadota bacterium]|jgi:uncharacterized membrane protein (UPF0127 family)